VTFIINEQTKEKHAIVLSKIEKSRLCCAKTKHNFSFLLASESLGIDSANVFDATRIITASATHHEKEQEP